MELEIKNLNLGALADSNYLGAEGSFSESVGLDLHSEPGVIKCNQKLSQDSGTTVTEFCKYAVSCSNGETYWFSADSGKIWRRASNGTWSAAYTTVATAGTHTCLGAIEYNGYIYWATQSRLHRITTTNALVATWATLDLNWATFTKTDASFHPMHEHLTKLFIGDANQVAGVVAGAFQANLLDLPSNARIKSLNHIGIDLLIGTFISTTVNQSEMYRWQYPLPSWTSSDVIPEVGVDTFVPIDNGILVVAGTKGNLYAYTGEILEAIKTIKGDYGGTNKTTVYDGSTLNFHSLPLFGVSNSSGNPCLCGIYSFGSHNRNYPSVLNLEYIASPGVTTNIEYGAIVGGGDTFLVAWKDSTGTPAYGVDILDTSNKYSGAYFITRIIAPQRATLKTIGSVVAGYRTLPSGTTITLSKYVNNGSVATITSAVNAKTNTQQGLVDVGSVTTLRVKVALTASGNTAPEIESLVIDI